MCVLNLLLIIRSLSVLLETMLEQINSYFSKIFLSAFFEEHSKERLHSFRKKKFEVGFKIILIYKNKKNWLI